MSNVGDLKPDPSIIGTIAKPPFVQLPDPTRVLGKRAERLRALASGHQLEGYLRFLADLTDAQLRILPELPEPDMPPAETIARAKEHAMPPLDRNTFKPDAAFEATLERLLSLAAALEMPAQAREALDRLRHSRPEARDAMMQQRARRPIPVEAWRNMCSSRRRCRCILRASRSASTRMRWLPSATAPVRAAARPPSPR